MDEQLKKCKCGGELKVINGLIYCEKCGKSIDFETLKKMYELMKGKK